MPKLPSVNRRCLVAALLSSLLLLQACQESEPPPGAAAPEGPVPAFRSVVDGKPRVLTLRLGDDIRVAYDTENGSLHKAWMGELETQGAVFDGRHGPQPASQGKVYLVDPEARWQLRGGELPEFNYRGYRLEGRQPVLLYSAYLPDVEISLEETPVARHEENALVLERKFEVSGLPSGVRLMLREPEMAADYRLEGAVSRTGAGHLSFSNGSSRIRLSIADAVAQRVPEPEAEEVRHPGEALIANSDCAACHNAEVKTVGPSYVAMAQRYSDEPETVQQLADKIIDGGTGNWGQVPMSPHPDLAPADARQMVEYILSLKPQTDSEETQWLMGEPAVAANMQPETPELNENTPGALFYLHYFSGDQPHVDNLRSEPPAMAAFSKQIHLPTIDAFAPEKERFAYQVKTQLKLDAPLKTRLRLVSDDGGYLYLDGERLIDNWGFHGPEPEDAEVDLEPGLHPLEIIFFQATSGATLSLQWFNPDSSEFEVVPESMLVATPNDLRTVKPVITDPKIIKSIPGDQREVAGLHPSFELYQARPDDFEPLVGGLDFLPDGRLVVTTWDPEGSVYIIENFTAPPEQIKVKRIARGLAEPLGVKVVDGDIYVLQKQELTRLIDDDGDEIIDRYMAVANDWSVTGNFHEFAFGLEYQDGYFYGTLATAILPGGASADPQAPDRGKAMRISKADGSVEFVASGLRTPNGIGFGVDGELFIADNQGDWLPASKIVELTEGAWYGSRSVDFEGTADLTETKPVVWLPQDEIGNSPSEPAPLNVGPYQNQMIHGEVTHGGIKRVYAERIDGRLQGAVFRFTQGLAAGVNRLDWTEDNELIIGGVGSQGNWSHPGKEWFGLQRMVYSDNEAFEMLSVSARSNGFDIEFTQPIGEGQNVSAEDFEILQWYYEPTAEYGGPKNDVTTLPVTAFSLSEDRTRASFELEGLKPDHLVYFRIKRPFVSAGDTSLWTTEAWYTLNAIPQDKPVQINADYELGHNELTQAEQDAGWQLLFDGESLEGLRNYNAETLGERWVVEDGALHMTGRRPGEDGWQTPNAGDLMLTPEPVENYELYLEWKLQEGGNSGIIYNVKEDPSVERPYMTGTEYQLLDNARHPDGQIVKHRAGDLYDLIESRFVAANPPGEWNRTRLVVHNGKIQHWLNGYKVVETEMWTPEWEAMIEGSKFADWEGFAQRGPGHIVLQDHGDKVWYRNIKLKQL